MKHDSNRPSEADEILIFEEDDFVFRRRPNLNGV